MEHIATHQINLMDQGRIPEVANGVRSSSGRANASAGSNPAPSADNVSDRLRVVAVVNRVAGGDPLGIVNELRARKPADVELHVVATTCVGDAERITADLIGETTNTVIVAVGGDGTVREVASGLYRGGAKGVESPTLLVAPAGTGNSNYLGFWNDATWSDVVTALYDRTFQRRRIDLGYIDELERVVLLGAGAGVIAQGLVTAKSLAGRGRDLLFRSAVETIQTYKPHPGRIVVDGRLLDESDMINVCVGGHRYRAGTFKLLPHSLVDDGLLDVVVLQDCANPLEPASLAMTGDITQHAAVRYGQGRQIIVERTDGEPLVFEHDGDVMPIDRSSYTISVLPSAITVAVASPAPACFAPRVDRRYSAGGKP